MSKPNEKSISEKGAHEVEENGEDETPERETWARQIDFLLALIGFSVGLGNVWRFPYLCYKNGGGAFLIPYFLSVLIGGIPLFYLEVALGQFMREGGLTAWRITPILQGLGACVTIIVFFLACYYNIILTWGFYYLFASFTSKLPWDSCDNSWNTENCRLDFTQNGTDANSTLRVNVVSAGNGTNETVKLQDPVTEFWERKVLGISGGLDEPGMIKWDLALCLLLAWFVVYFCIWKGIKTSGKVMYFTATSPYIFMIILLIRGCTLPGAIDGILFYLVPDWERMKDIQVWVDAGTQIFFSYSISLGALTALGSFNKFNHNSYRDSFFFALANSGTSILAGFVIFTILGFMAHEQGTTVDKVAESGPGLAFIAYPKAVSQLPIAPLWSILFFVMLILLGLDSQFVSVEGLATAFIDAFPSLRKGHRREIFIAFLCVLMFAVGLSMVTNGGMYVFQLMDYYSGSRIILLVGFFECIAIGWIYGVNRFYDNLEMMYGFRINPYMKICWMVLSPVFCLAVFIMSAINYSELSYERPTGVYKYPDWGVGAGWALACCSVVFIPGMAIYNTIKYKCEGKPLRDLFRPEGLKPFQLRPQDVAGLELEVVGNVHQVAAVSKDHQMGSPGGHENAGFEGYVDYRAGNRI